MSDLKTVLVFVSMLSTTAGSAEPAILVIVCGSSVVDRLGARLIKHRARDCAGVNSASFFRGWDALDSMSARFIVETGNTLFERDRHHRVR